jgi:hypothetical protein
MIACRPCAHAIELLLHLQCILVIRISTCVGVSLIVAVRLLSAVVIIAAAAVYVNHEVIRCPLIFL